MIDKVNKEEFRGFALDYIKQFDAIPLEFEDSSGIVIKAAVCWQLAIELKLINKLLNKGDTMNPVEKEQLVPKNLQ